MHFRFLLAAALVLMPALAQAATLDRIRETGTLRIGVREDAPPFSYRNEQNEPAGYVVELCRIVADQIREAVGVERLPVEPVGVTAENGFQAVADGDIDLLCGATTITIGRRDTVEFSVPIFIDGAGVVVRRGGATTLRDFAGQKVGVRAGTTTERSLRASLDDLGVGAEIVTFDSHEAGLGALKNQEVAGYFADRAILIYLMQQDQAGSADLVLSDQYFTYETYGLAFAKDDPAFRDLVDRTLSRIYRSRAIGEVFKKGFGPDANPSDVLQALYLISALED
ncbi:amino acid ABC transporter substrate-binding protein [Marinivivus vitaminiproducens]|uniref:amino acid ABC transporter substrate-binding protein n=1 Tax=Marinivivus vitaminiproducens TaxID=3035935 RepID=UPI0027996373|nr:amino acid ABC transporter substrate-binding protein [Geminicoccaceae bacterium SCSIO 64248]